MLPLWSTWGWWSARNTALQYLGRLIANGRAHIAPVPKPEAIQFWCVQNQNLLILTMHQQIKVL